MATTTTFSGTVYGSFQHPGLADSFVRVLGCDDGSVVVAWGNALEDAAEGDEIAFGGGGDGENGYRTIIDPPDLTPAGDYCLAAFLATQPDGAWSVHANGDISCGLLHVGHLGDDGTLSLSADLRDCGLQWDAVQEAIPAGAGG